MDSFFAMAPEDDAIQNEEKDARIAEEREENERGEDEMDEHLNREL